MKIKFQVPLYVYLFNDEVDEELVEPTESIVELVAEDLNFERLEKYSNGLVKSYVAYPEADFETGEFRLFIECETNRPKAALDWWFGQFSDGWGEGFEQQSYVARNFFPDAPDGEISIQTWNGEDSQKWPYEVLDKKLD